MLCKLYPVNGFFFQLVELNLIRKYSKLACLTAQSFVVHFFQQKKKAPAYSAINLVLTPLPWDSSKLAFKYLNEFPFVGSFASSRQHNKIWILQGSV